MTTAIHTTIERFLAKWGLRDPQIVAALADSARLVSYAKSATVLRAGDAVTQMGIIRRGLVRYYYSDAAGKFWNKAFHIENDPVVAASAILTDSPSPFTIEALEPSEIVMFPGARLLQLEADLRPLHELTSRLITHAFIRNEQREAMLLTSNAEQRFQWLLRHESHLLRRVPQFHLASYIGIDAVSLSRIKRKLE